jgi:transcriptional regulator with XRE-family HTH domain
MLGISEFARRVGVDRGTVHRWESGKTSPTDPEVVQRFAEALNLDLDESLAAAGLRPGVTAPAEPTREVDAEIELVRTDPTLSDGMKVRIIKLIYDRRQRDREAAMEDTRRLIELMKREAG